MSGSFRNSCDVYLFQSFFKGNIAPYSQLFFCQKSNYGLGIVLFLPFPEACQANFVQGGVSLEGGQRCRFGI